MKKSTKIRIAVCVVVLIAAITLGIIFDGILTGAHTRMWQRAIYLVGIVGTGLGALTSMLTGWKGFVFSYAGLSLIMIPRLLPKPWNGIAVAAMFGALLIWGAIPKKKNTEIAAQPETELTEEDQRLSEKLRPLTLVVNPWNSKRYQLVCRGKELIAYYVGSDFKGIDESLLQTGEEFRQPDKTDIIIPVDTIRSIHIRELPNIVREQAVIKTAGKKYRFNLMAADEKSSLAGLLKDIAPGKVTIAAIKAKSQPEETAEDTVLPDGKRGRIFRVLKICFGVYLGLVNLPWMFIDVPYKLFSILSIIALPVLLAAYICFPGELTMLENKECKGKVSIFTLVLFSSLLPALRSLMDFNITGIGKLILAGAIGFAFLLGAVMLCTKEWRRRKSILAILCMFLLFYALGVAAQINYDFDNSTPAAQQAVMVDKHISRSRRGPDTYYIKLRLSGGREMQVKTGSERYYSYEKGDEVLVYTFEGALGIPYVFAS